LILFHSNFFDVRFPDYTQRFQAHSGFWIVGLGTLDPKWFQIIEAIVEKFFAQNRFLLDAISAQGFYIMIRPVHIMGNTLGQVINSKLLMNLLILDLNEEFLDDYDQLEGILSHELGHVIDFKIQDDILNFSEYIARAFKESINKRGQWKHDYASESILEYWAEGVRMFMGGDMQTPSINSIMISHPVFLMHYDPMLLKLVKSVLGTESMNSLQPYSKQRLREIAQADYERAIHHGDDRAAKVLRTYFIEDQTNSFSLDDCSDWLDV